MNKWTKTDGLMLALVVCAVVLFILSWLDSRVGGAMATLGTLVAAALAYVAIAEQRNTARRERRDRQLNEIIDWAEKAHSCVSDHKLGVTNPDLTARWSLASASEIGKYDIASTIDAGLGKATRQAIDQFEAIGYPTITKDRFDACLACCETLIKTAQGIKVRKS